MPVPDRAQVQNKLLQAMPLETYRLIAPHLHYVSLKMRQALVEADKPTRFVFFIESGLASVVATNVDGTSIGIGHIGREGMTGFHTVQMADRTPDKTFMQAAGTALLMPVVCLREVLEQDAAGRAFFLRYVQSYMIQMAQSAVTSGRYLIHQRLARWILMCHDRLGDGDMPLTHEFLALMLGVRRSGVTEQVHIIEGERAIKATRGHIRVTDRANLEEIAGGCYGLPEAEYERLVGVPLRTL